MNPEIENDMSKEAPAEPWANLTFMLKKYLLIDEENLDDAKKFLSAGNKIDLPTTVNLGDQTLPYRLYPIASYSLINSCVKLLEKSLEESMRGFAPDEETEKQLVGVMCLADSLFHSACTDPDGKFTIHHITQAKKPGESGKKISINPHGRRVRQLAVRLDKYRAAKLHLQEKTGAKRELPELSCKQVVEEETRISAMRWNVIDPNDWDGKALWEMTDSLDRMNESTGFEAREEGNPVPASAGGGYDPEFEDNAEGINEAVDQAAWLGLGDELGSSTLHVRDVQRANVISRTPKAWIWNYNESPMEFVVNYLCNNAKPALEEAHSLLVRGLTNPALKEAGNLAVVLNTSHKKNPDNFWKMIKRIAPNFDGSRHMDLDKTLQKLDCARFTICLELNNLRHGIDPAQFQKAFKEKIHQVLGSAKQRDTLTRNELLLETLKDITTDNGGEWDKVRQDQWLENLQTMAIGSYENSMGMENQRKQLLDRLNHLFKTPRQELDRTRHTPERADVVGKLETLLASAANSFHGYLTGKTGQMTRRELRTKIHTLKKEAETRGQSELAAKLGESAAFISSISSQVKSGEWYEKKDENVEKLFNFLALMLECPKNQELEFPGSAEPEPKDAVEVTCDFLQAIQGKEMMMGNHTIEENLAIAREHEMEHEGGRLTAALTQITKSIHAQRGENQSITSRIETRREVLAQAIAITEKVHGSGDPVQELHAMITREAEILRRPQTFDPAEQETFKSNLRFWQGLHYLIQNVQNRKVDPHYQVDASGKGTIQNLTAAAKAKLQNKEILDPSGAKMQQFNLSRTRERTLLASIAVPLGLWLANESKSQKNNTSHEEFISGLKERKDACDICLEITTSDLEIDEKTADYKKCREQTAAMTNSYVISEIISALENPADLAAGLEWEMRNPTAAAELASQKPELDTPSKKLDFLRTHPDALKAPEKAKKETPAVPAGMDM